MASLADLNLSVAEFVKFDAIANDFFAAQEIGVESPSALALATLVLARVVAS